MEVVIKFSITSAKVGEKMPDPHAIAEGLLDMFTNPNDPNDLIFRVRRGPGRYVELQIADADLVSLEA